MLLLRERERERDSIIIIIFYFRLTLIWDRVDLAEKILGPLVTWTSKSKDVKDERKEEKNTSKVHHDPKGETICSK